VEQIFNRSYTQPLLCNVFGDCLYFLSDKIVHWNYIKLRNRTLCSALYYCSFISNKLPHSKCLITTHHGPTCY